MDREVLIEVPGLPRLQVAGAGAAYGNPYARSAEVKRWKNAAMIKAAAAGLPDEPFARAWITCTRFSSAREAPDYDNLVASFKPIVDGLVLVGVLLDDNPDVIVGRTYNWKPASPRHGKIVVLVEEVI